MIYILTMATALSGYRLSGSILPVPYLDCYFYPSRAIVAVPASLIRAMTWAAAITFLICPTTQWETVTLRRNFRIKVFAIGQMHAYTYCL